jgi:hypothetical protein
VTPDGLKRWVNGALRDEWGVKAAARIFWICQEGRDYTLTDPFERADPTDRRGELGDRVPGAVRPARTVFDVSQALAWIADQRPDRAERQAAAASIEKLVRSLTLKARKRRN